VGEACEDGVVLLLIHTTDIGGEALGASGEGRITKVANEGGDGVLGQSSLVHAASDGEGDQQNGISERVFLGPCAQSRGEVQEFLGERSRRVWGWNVWHARRMARIVRRSKWVLQRHGQAKWQSLYRRG
jgi:hypothetical protein